MKQMRKGLGLGKGSGYYNIIPQYDSYVHSLSAKGVKQKLYAFGKKKIEMTDYENKAQRRKKIMQHLNKGKDFAIIDYDMVTDETFEVFPDDLDYLASIGWIFQSISTGTRGGLLIFKKTGSQLKAKGNKLNALRTISDVRALNRQTGKHFFDRDSMRFFDSRIETKGNLIGGKYFITSEQFHGSQGSNPRKYTVREPKSDGRIETIGEFNSFRTKEDAIDFARGMI